MFQTSSPIGMQVRGIRAGTGGRRDDSLDILPELPILNDKNTNIIPHREPENTTHVRGGVVPCIGLLL